jgi:hypothetical protein
LYNEHEALAPGSKVAAKLGPSAMNAHRWEVLKKGISILPLTIASRYIVLKTTHKQQVPVRRLATS